MSKNIHGDNPVCPHCGARLLRTAMAGAELIAVERQRQIEAEGWTAAHDDTHTDGDLALAGACYAAFAVAFDDRQGLHSILSFAKAAWPWGREWWKPKGTLRDLVRAGALIAAEIDRLQRRESSTPNDRVDGPGAVSSRTAPSQTGWATEE